MGESFPHTSSINRLRTRELKLWHLAAGNFFTARYRCAGSVMVVVTDLPLRVGMLFLYEFQRSLVHGQGLLPGAGAAILIAVNPTTFTPPFDENHSLPQNRRANS